MSRVLITGCCGYLGSVLTPALLHLDHEVIGLDSLIYDQDSLLESCGHNAFTFVRGDVRNTTLVKELIAKCDAVIWLAAIVGAPACEQDERQAWAVNRDSIVNALWSLGDKLFIYPNSNSGYGIGGESECTEDDELRPISVYGKSKVQAEYAIREQLRRSIVFRFATLFGLSPRFRRDLLVNDFTLRALDDGTIVLYEPHFRRNYLHVQDAANAIIWAIDGKLKDNQVYNCGIDDANLTKLQLCEKIKEYVPNLDIVISDKRSDPDKRDYQISNQKLYATNWRPQVILDDGIKEIIKGWPMLRHRNRYSNV